MNAIKKTITNFITETEGATAVEYAILLALIISVVVLAVGAVGSSASGHFQDASEGLGKSLNN